MSRLKTEMQVDAALRMAQAQNIFALVQKKGDPKSGAILLEIQIDRHHSMLLARQIKFDLSLSRPDSAEDSPDDGYEWVAITGDAPVPAHECSARLEKEIGYDPDCWVVVIEDAEARNIFASG